MANTTNQNYPKPVETTDLSVDVSTFQTAFDMIDLDVKSLLTAMDTKSATGHGHAVADVVGLQGDLDGKALTGHTHALDDLTDVDGAGGAADGMLLQKTPVGFVPVSVSAAVGPSVTALVDAGLAAKMDKSANLGDVVASAARTNIGAANIAGDTFTGPIIQPNLPAFTVESGVFVISGASVHRIGYSALATVTVRHNNGAHFNTANGLFTAPHDGIYVFFMNYEQNSSSSANPYSYFEVNGTKAVATKHNYYNIYQANSDLLVVALSAGDFVEAGVLRDGVSIVISTFSGWQIG